MTTYRFVPAILPVVTVGLILSAPAIGAGEVKRGERLPPSAYGPVVIESMAEAILRDQRASSDGLGGGDAAPVPKEPPASSAEQGRSGGACPLSPPQDNGTPPDLEESFQGTIRGDAGSLYDVPDTMGAIGPGHFVETLNGNFSVFDRVHPHDRLANITLRSFFLAGGSPQFCDPRVLFDHHSGRWVAIAMDFEWKIYFAFSMTQDPLGDWLKTYFVASELGWLDYPTLGVDANGIYTSARVDDGTPAIFAIDKAPLLDEQNPALGNITAYRGIPYEEGTIQPAHTYGDPGGEYLVSRVDSTHLRIRRIDPPLTAPTLTDVGDILVEEHANPLPIPALGSPEALVWADPRPMMSVYRDGSLWTCHTICVDERAACRWYKIDPVAPQLQDYGTVTDDTLHYFYPSIMVNQVGRVVMGFSGSSPDQYAAAYYTGRRAEDAPGEMARPVLLRQGEAPYTLERWGDYSYTTLDPVDELTFWTVQEYTHAEDFWGTWIASFDFDCNDNGIDDHADVAGGSPDCNGNLVPDECEDCNGNGFADECDIAGGTSGDCNDNDVPDDCESATDCNDNGQQDICEFAAGTGQDCNRNGLLDECDITTGTSDDCNANTIPDECEPDPSGGNRFPPYLPADPEHQATKHRYISVDPRTNCDRQIALKVEVAEMTRCAGDPRRSCLEDNDCRKACENDLDKFCTWSGHCGGTPCIEIGPCVDMAPDYNPPLSWIVQQPFQEPTGCIPSCTDTDWIARLSDTVYSEGWSAFPVLHIGDCPIVPCTTYNVYACDPSDTAFCSEPLVVPTQVMPWRSPADFGDVSGTITPDLEMPPPDGYVGVTDLQSWILTALNYGTAEKPQAHPTRMDLHGLGDGIPPNYVLNVADLQLLYVFGFTNRLPWENTMGGLAPGDCP